MCWWYENSFGFTWYIINITEIMKSFVSYLLIIACFINLLNYNRSLSFCHLSCRNLLLFLLCLQTPNGNVEAKVMCFYRRRDLPNPLIMLADKHQSEYHDRCIVLSCIYKWLRPKEFGDNGLSIDSTCPQIDPLVTFMTSGVSPPTHRNII